MAAREKPSDSKTAPRRVVKLRSGKKRRESAKLSKTKKPENLTLEQWQLELRRQYGRAQDYELSNVGDHPVFSEFRVTNPESKGSYRVRIRGVEPGDNQCSCPDFATNELGTCKHIEFVLQRLGKARKTGKLLRDGFEPSFSEVVVQYGSRRSARFRPGADCPQALARLASEFFDDDQLLRPEAVGNFERFLEGAGGIDHDLRCDDAVLELIAEHRDAGHRREKVAEMFPSGRRSKAFKDLLHVDLYDYQRDAVLFAARAGRCLIGDEMGLGKTIQAVAAAEVMARLFGVERVLIVCPTSLKHQWLREIERISERSAEVVAGNPVDRAEAIAREGPFFKLVNYDTVHADLDAIADWGPDLVILDEAQRIKNWATRTARSVKKIASPYAIVLTGTPLENRLEELVSIVQFVDQHRLGPTYRLLHDHQLRDPFGKVVGYRELDRIGKTLEPVLIRRQKSEVLGQLPERIDNHVFVPLTEPQRAMHDEDKEVVARIVEKWRRHGFLSEADQRRMMVALQRMRMVCDSTFLLDPEQDHGLKVGEAATVLDEVLERPDVKVVAFSQWLRMHELMKRRLDDRGRGHVVFHGGLSNNRRGKVLERFREDPDCRVFLSTDAGGVGLNMQHASVVLNLDLPWNPAVLEQRVGRVHRLGQHRPVQVVNFVAQGSIEEGMLGLLAFKKSLFSGVLDGGTKEVFLGGTRLKRFMESVETATGSIPDLNGEEARDARSAQAEAGPPGDERTVEPRPEPSAAIAPATPDPLAGLLQSGLALLGELAAASNDRAPARPDGLVRRDERTGRPYLHLPAPPPEVLDQALRAFGALIEHMRK